MARVWSDTAQILCVHPGGDPLQGRAEVLQSWAAIFSNAEPPSIGIRLLQRIERSGIAVHRVEEWIRPRRKPATPGARVFAGNLYLEHNGSWRMVEHHARVWSSHPAGGETGTLPH